MNVRVNGKNYEIRHFTGEVTGTSKVKETRVSGSFSGGAHRNAPVSGSVSPTTVKHHKTNS
ncbi:hypothetical protein RM530_01485 [Algiphilus sp. W345]|uniref:Uncharacterized protein n=1 Tax=Banduia mediterranea TaxID=3075609 RepID=A0ABU2WDT2_9GAMM|nr:hypothetical protein [Algiphilus sp. W345]MDT0496039.1 hypothetical protein [Algiphilus sp. W345]